MDTLKGKRPVVAIILEACDWQNHPLNRFEVLPYKGKPINKWSPRSDGWQNVVEGIRKVVSKVRVLASDVTIEEAISEWVFQQGNFLMMLGQIDRAIEAYSHVIEFNPGDTAAYNNRGVAYNSKGNNNRAIKDFDKAMQLDRDDAIVYNNRGTAYLDKGDYNRAIKDFNIAIQRNPHDTRPYNNRGVAYDKQGKKDSCH